MHGSNTIGAELMPAFIEGFAAQNGYTVARTPGLSTEVETLDLSFGADPIATVALERFGSSTSFRGLIADAAEIGMSSRPIKDAEEAQFQELFGAGLRQNGSEHVVALDGLVVVVSPANGKTAIKLSDVSKVFSGEIRDWAELGRAPGPITVHARDSNSGTFDTFKSLVLKPNDVELRPDALRYASNVRLAEAVARDPLAIGFTPLAFADRAKALAIALECGMVIEPQKFTVKSEEYPLSRRLFLYTVGAPATASARDLLAYARSDAAQERIAQVGFVDQAPQLQEAAMYADRMVNAMAAAGASSGERAALQTFFSRTGGMRRLSPTFRFRTGGVLLDAKSQNDAERLARWILRPENAEKRVLLIGFADSTGGYAANLELSARRAEAVRRAILIQMRPGFDPARIEAMGLSTVAPIACNDDALGQAANRRVEAWVSK